MTTLLGFDYGPKKIGVAVGQTITRSANPVTTLTSHDDQPDWAGISDLIKTWKPDALIVGMPYNMDDSETPLAKRVKRFGRRLEGRYGLPVHFADERLTSIEARRQLGNKVKNIRDYDAVAAKLILETWLCEQS